MNLNNVELVLTAGLPSQLPGNLDNDLIHIALCGRSNVGKSSLINKLLGRKKLARVSSEPGKTITVNAYEVDKALYLVDLPGYGYARRSFSEREKWKELILKYFETDADILYLQLVDLKVGLTKDDETMVDFLLQNKLPFAVVATKADKLNKTNKAASIENLKNNPHIPADTEIIPFSAVNGEGAEDVWRVINEYRDYILESRGNKA